MFGNLVESGLHQRDAKRKASFFLLAILCHALLIAVGALIAIYSREEYIGHADLETIALLSPPPLKQLAENRQPPSHLNSAAHNAGVYEPPRETSDSVRGSTTLFNPNSTHFPQANLPPGSYQGGPEGPFGGSYNGRGTGNRGEGPVVVTTEDSPPTLPRPQSPAPERVRLSSSVLAGKAIFKPAPPYPRTAQILCVSGAVIVEVSINEKGIVTSAHATNGHPLLRQAAESAAYSARFLPTTISGVPVKVYGSITYNFVLQ